MKLTRGGIVLLIPAVAVFAALLVGPIAIVFNESFKEYVPGRIGSATDAPYTLTNYFELIEPAYGGFFLGTFQLGLFAAVIALLVGFPIAYFVARMPTGWLRKLSVGFLICMMFLSGLVRVYSLELTFGSVGALRPVLRFLELSPLSRGYIECLVVAGLLHFIVPMATLTLVGTIQNVNPRLAEAAQALGAPRWKAHLTVTVPLCMQGILSAFLITYTLSISAFVVPMILGKGKVVFVSNLIFSRFSEVANYPSGAAISVIMLVASMLIIYVISRFAVKRW